MIKRLGSATPGVSGETITQAAFVNSLLPMLSLDPVSDRDILLRGKKLEMPSPDELEKQPFRLLFIEEQDSQIARNVSEYFHAVASLWPDDWKSRDKGNMLPRTNGFRAFMRFLKDAYLYLRENSGERQFDRDQYQEILQKVDIEPGAFSTETFPPGTSGETLLLDRIRSNTNIGVD
jgi:hypothetical protein